MTFADRVATFWQRFETIAPDIYEMIESGRSDQLLETFPDFMQSTLPNLAWSFGPGPTADGDDASDQDGSTNHGEAHSHGEARGHSLTLSGEGIVAKQYLTRYWRRAAPVIDGWTFYDARQPSPTDRLEGVAIALEDRGRIDATGCRVRTRADPEQQQFELDFWHPEFETLSEDDRGQIMFLLLDEALGELGTEQFLSVLQPERFDDSDDKDTKVMPLLELPAFLRSAAKYYGWEILSPLESRSMYQMRSDDDGAFDNEFDGDDFDGDDSDGDSSERGGSSDGDVPTPRGDTIIGSTSILRVVTDYMAAGGLPDDAVLGGTGAECVYAAFPTRALRRGDEAAARSELEDLLDEALANGRDDASTGVTGPLGHCVGGAIGGSRSYLDLVLFNGETSREAVRRTLDQLNLGGIELIRMG